MKDTPGRSATGRSIEEARDGLDSRGGRSVVGGCRGARRVPHALPSDRTRQHRTAGDEVRLVGVAAFSLASPDRILDGTAGHRTGGLDLGRDSRPRLGDAVLRTDAGRLRLQLRTESG